MVLNSAAIQRTVTFILIVLLFLQYHVYVFVAGEPVPLVGLFIPLAFIFFVALGKTRLSVLHVGVLLYCLTGFVYVVLAVAISGNVGWLYSLVTLAISPFTFLLAGRYLGVKSSSIAFAGAIIMTAIFSFFQIAGHVSFFGIAEMVREVSQAIQEVWAGRVVYGRPVGVWADPNINGFFAGICFWSIVAFRKSLPWPVSAFLLGVSVVVLAAAGSRGAMVAVIASLVVYFLALGSDFLSRKYLAMVFGAVILLFTVFVVIQNSPGSRVYSLTGLGAMLDDASMAERFSAWARGWEVFLSNPFGVVVPPQFVTGVSSDNQFVYFLVRGGVVYLLAFVVMLASVVLHFGRKEPKIRAIALSVTALVIVNSLTIVVFNLLLSSLYFLLIGYLAGQGENFGRGVRRVGAVTKNPVGVYNDGLKSS